MPAAKKKTIALSQLKPKQVSRPHYTVLEEDKGGKLKTRTLSSDEFIGAVRSDKTGRFAAQHLDLLAGPTDTISGLKEMFG